MKRLLSPATNMPGLTGAGAAVYAAVLMVYHVVNHQAAFSVPVALAGIMAGLSWISRQYSTPVADPKDGNGAPLTTAAPAAPEPAPVPAPQVVVTPPAAQAPGTY